MVEPRQCAFIGTTNRSEYLRDETGARRFWPVKVGKIDLNALARDRDQLFVEAVQAYRVGETWWPTEAFAREHIKPEQEARREVDPWEEMLQPYLDTKDRVTVGELALHVLVIPRDKMGTREQRRISNILTALGWERCRTKKGSSWNLFQIIR